MHVNPTSSNVNQEPASGKAGAQAHVSPLIGLMMTLKILIVQMDQMRVKKFK